MFVWIIRGNHISVIAFYYIMMHIKGKRSDAGAFFFDEARNTEHGKGVLKINACIFLFLLLCFLLWCLGAKIRVLGRKRSLK